MKHIEESKKAIDNAGGNKALARKLADRTGLDYDKLYGRVRMWRIKGVSLPHIRMVARLGHLPMTKLIP